MTNRQALTLCGAILLAVLIMFLDSVVGLGLIADVVTVGSGGLFALLVICSPFIALYALVRFVKWSAGRPS